MSLYHVMEVMVAADGAGEAEQVALEAFADGPHPWAPGPHVEQCTVLAQAPPRWRSAVPIDVFTGITDEGQKTCAELLAVVGRANNG